MLGVGIAESDEDLFLPEGVLTEAIGGEQEHRNHLATGFDIESDSDSEVNISMISSIDETSCVSF